MNGRMRGLSLGLALLALLGIASVAGRGVFAQDATPTPSTSSGTSTNQTTRGAFLDAFAAALGVTDQAQIDAAIKTAVDQVLAEKVAAGEMTQEQADIIKAQVANGDYRALGGFGLGHGPMGGPMDGSMGGHHGKGRGGWGDHGNGNQNGKSDTDNDDNGTTPSTDGTPAASSAGVSA